jgi:hypothetical protein
MINWLAQAHQENVHWQLCLWRLWHLCEDIKDAKDVKTVASLQREVLHVSQRSWLSLKDVCTMSL